MSSSITSTLLLYSLRPNLEFISLAMLAGNEFQGSACFCPPYLVLGLQIHATTPGSYTGHGDLNLSPHPCVTGAVVSEHLPRP